ncbi:MAG TPA: hypothetical protein VL309_06515 [Vicinamibacterales bacterium]|jgi:hypothetical protein|nr:hypothetical protein [Vicinamibacterales bacterium]
MVARFFLYLAVALVPLQPADSADRTLKDIGSVSIAVEPIAPAVAALGVTDAALRDQVQRALKGAGVPAAAAPGGASMVVTINAVRIETTRRSTSGVAYTVTLSVEQGVTLARTGDTARASTWRRAGIGVARPGQAAGAIRDQLKEYLDAFVSAWRAANSR